jgi:hypothetical protein
MCGRAKLETDVSEIKIAFRIPPEYPTPNFPPSWNVAPTDSLPIVRCNDKTGSRTLDLMRWGLVPYWAKDIRVGFSTINAMAETVETKPVFRDAFARRRCIVPVDAFYEWKRIDAKAKQPYRRVTLLRFRGVAARVRGARCEGGSWKFRQLHRARERGVRLGTSAAGPARAHEHPRSVQRPKSGRPRDRLRTAQVAPSRTFTRKAPDGFSWARSGR